MSKNVVGNVVVSLQGRDKGKLYLVTNQDKNTLSLVDGYTHKLKNPKKKNIKHTKYVKNCDMDLQLLHDCDIIYMLKCALVNFKEDC